MRPVQLAEFSRNFTDPMMSTGTTVASYAASPAHLNDAQLDKDLHGHAFPLHGRSFTVPPSLDPFLKTVKTHIPLNHRGVI